MPKSAPEYVIGQSAVAPNKFTVAKFEGGDEPKVVYDVTYNPETGYGKCDCPAAAYRGTGSGDKHVLMVKQWLAQRTKENQA